MKTIMLLALIFLIGIGAAFAGPVESASPPVQQDSTSSWANG